LKVAIAMSVLSVSGDAVEDSADALPAPGSLSAVLPCVYCRADIAADDFEFWTAAHRLLSATCPRCQRRVTVAAATWRRGIRRASGRVSEAQR
jgi:hypothetical protein